MIPISELVLSTLADVAQLEDVKSNLDIRLYETHVLDSISTVELILALSDRLGLEISPAELDHEQWATPRKIVQYFEARIAQFTENGWVEDVSATRDWDRRASKPSKTLGEKRQGIQFTTVTPQNLQLIRGFVAELEK